MVQRFGVAQFVVRGELLMRSCEVPLPVVATKFNPSTASREFCCAPVTTLEGKRASIVGPDATATVAVAASDGFAVFVAVMRIAFGEGAAAGAM